MKKITFFLTLLLLAMCSIGASAQTTVTVTVCDNTSYVDTKGTWADVSNNLYKTFTTGSASGLAGLTITSDAYVMRQGYYQSYKYTYQIVGTPGVSNTITLTAPSGYVIVSYALTTMKTSTSSSNTSVIVTAEDGTNTGSFNTANGTNLSVSNVNASSTYFVVAPTSNNPSVELNIFNFTITLEKLPFTASTSANPIWYAMSTANTASWWQANSNNTINNNNNRSLPSGTADAYAWAFYGDPTNGYKIQNKSTGRYLGGRTASGGALTLVEEANAVLFVPIFNNSILEWKSKDYGYYVDRASGEPYAHTSGQGINFADLYDVNFTCSQNEVTAVRVGDASVNVGTNVLISTNALVTISGYNYGIANYDGYSTLSEALTSGAADDGVISLLLSPCLTNLSSANSSKAYTITAPRGFLNIASTSETKFRATAASSASADMSNSLHQWTIVTLNGNQYLYNVATKKFATFDGNLVTSAPASVAGTSSSYKAGYPIFLSLIKGSDTRYLNMDGNCNLQINSYNTHDDGNVYKIVEIPNLTITPEAYSVSFTCSGGQISSVFVDGTEVPLNTAVVLTSGATVSSGASVNAIETYNGYSTLAEALANLGGTTGTIDVALPAVLSNITINVMRGSTVVKTVTIENVPENDVITVADEVGVPNYVTALTPATITATDEDQTVNVTYTSTLPFTLSDDPTSANATAYLMTLRTTYAHGSNTSTTCDLGDDTYYWTFGGDEYNGITVYNKNNGYMNVANTDKSNATFSETPTVFYVSPNSKETNGFNLNIPQTNTYINRRDDLVSTWVSSAATNDAGSCLKVYTDADVLPGLLEALAPYFTYAGSVGALTESAAADLNSTYQSFLANTPHSSLYLALKDAIDNNLVELSEGYYIVYSGYDGFTTPKAMYYNTSNNKIAWTTADGSAAQVMKLKAVSGTSNYRIYSPLTDKYLQTKDGATTDAEESGLTLTVTPVSVGKVVLVYNANGGDDAALHANGHSGGSGVSGTLTNWTLDSEASMWRLYPLDIPEITLIEPNGVAEGDEVYQSFAYGSNKQLPLNVGVHYISTNSGNFAHIETVSSSAIRANEGYIIRGVKGATVPLLPIGEVDALSSTNLLVGVVEPTKVYSGYMLAYKGNDAEQKFYKIKNTGLTIPAYRSYLTAAAAANVRGLELLFGGIGDDELTGIDGINTGGTEGAIFDLQGRRVTKPEKGGIYIINGKKVMK